MQVEVYKHKSSKPSSKTVGKKKYAGPEVWPFCQVHCLSIMKRISDGQATRKLLRPPASSNVDCTHTFMHVYTYVNMCIMHSGCAPYMHAHAYMRAYTLHAYIQVVFHTSYHHKEAFMTFNKFRVDYSHKDRRHRHFVEDFGMALTFADSSEHGERKVRE